MTADPQDRHGLEAFDETVGAARLASWRAARAVAIHDLAQTPESQNTEYAARDEEHLAYKQVMEAAALLRQPSEERYCTYCGERIADNKHALRLGAHLPCIGLHVGLWPKRRLRGEGREPDAWIGASHGRTWKHGGGIHVSVYREARLAGPDAVPVYFGAAATPTEPHLCICTGPHGGNDNCAYRYQDEQGGTDGTGTAPTPTEPMTYADGVEHAAKVAEVHAIRLRNTSHRDGLGMGWQAGEELCREVAAFIRATRPIPFPAPTPEPEPPRRP